MKKVASDNQKIQTSPKSVAESKTNQVSPRNTVASSIRSSVDSTGKLTRVPSAKSIILPSQKTIHTLSPGKVAQENVSPDNDITKKMGSGDNREAASNVKKEEEHNPLEGKSGLKDKSQASEECVTNGGEAGMKSNGEHCVNGSSSSKLNENSASSDVSINGSSEKEETLSNGSFVTAGNDSIDNVIEDFKQNCSMKSGLEEQLKDEANSEIIVNDQETKEKYTENGDCGVVSNNGLVVNGEHKIASSNKELETTKEDAVKLDNNIVDEVKEESAVVELDEIVKAEKTIENDEKLPEEINSPSDESSEMTASKETSSDTIIGGPGELFEEKDSSPKPEVTKKSIRSKVWDHMEKNNLVQFPRPCMGRIPNFLGAPQASDSLAKMDLFKNSKVIKVNPDKPQELTRFHTLEHGKLLLVPVPRLRQGLFQAIVPPAEANRHVLKLASQQSGMIRYSKPIRLDDSIRIDLIVLGSVAVDMKGHRIGKGEGYADLEFALMMKMNAISENTVIVTTVHDCQVMDDLPEHLFKEHDVPVDWIITPSRVIEVQEKLPRPNRIIWSILSQRRILDMPILQFLRERELSEGKDCTLKEVDSDVEDKPTYYKPQAFRRFPPRQRKPDYSRSTGDPVRDLNPRFQMQNYRAPSRNTRNVINSQRYPPNRVELMNGRNNNGGGGGGGGGFRRNGYYRLNVQPIQSAPPVRMPSYNYRSSSRSMPPQQQLNGGPPSGRARSVQRMDRRPGSRPRSRPSSNRQRPPNRQARSAARVSDDQQRQKSVSPLQHKQAPVPTCVSSVETMTQNNNHGKEPRKRKSKPPIAFSVRIRNIEPGVRVRDLKMALNERGVKPRDITWRGYKGVALLHFVKMNNRYTAVNKPNSTEEIINLLEGLSLKPKPVESQSLVIEVANKPLAAINSETNMVACS